VTVFIKGYGVHPIGTHLIGFLVPSERATFLVNIAAAARPLIKFGMRLWRNL
jgi:hypothetical protein